jgi:ATP-dependent protease ClpP protease subunit
MLNLFGVVGEHIRSNDVIQQIQNYEGDVIDVIINSPGGSVYEGMAIYGYLKKDPRPVKTTILGMGASIASIIFMAGDEREISDGSTLMIHNGLAPNAGGNKYDLAETIEHLSRIDDDMKNIYSSVTGLQDNILESMLERETFLNADEAIKLGFATNKSQASELVALYNKNKYKDEAMAELDKEEMTFLQGVFAKLGFSPKAESTEEAQEPVAMDEEEETEATAEVDAEVEALKAKVSELEESLQAKLDAQEVEDKQELIFNAMRENKLTLAQGKEYFAMGIEDVQAKIGELPVNATGFGKGAEPSAVLNFHEQYKAIKNPAERSAFYHNNKTQINKDKLKG